MNWSDLVNPLEAAFFGLSAVAAGGAAFGAVRALGYLRGTFSEAQQTNKLTLAELHARVRPRIAFRQGSARPGEKPMAIDAGFAISGQDNIHEVTFDLNLGPDADASCDPDYQDFVEPGTLPITLRWAPLPLPRVGLLAIEYLDGLGRRTRWEQPVTADSKTGLRPVGRPETTDIPVAAVSAARPDL